MTATSTEWTSAIEPFWGRVYRRGNCAVSHLGADGGSEPWIRTWTRFPGPNSIVPVASRFFRTLDAAIADMPQPPND